MEIINSLLYLRKAKRLLNKGRLDKLFALLNVYAKRHAPLSTPNKEDLDKVAHILDKACMLYPTKTLCLAWAASFVMLLLKRGWRCQLLIGVQTLPFYAHAWVELNGKVINDDPQLQERLAPIFCLNFEDK